MRAHLPRILVILLLLAAGSVIAGSLLRDAHPRAELTGWSIGLVLVFLAAFAAAHVFAGRKDD